MATDQLVGGGHQHNCALKTSWRQNRIAILRFAILHINRYVIQPLTVLINLLNVKNQQGAMFFLKRIGQIIVTPI